VKKPGRSIHFLTVAGLVLMAASGLALTGSLAQQSGHEQSPSDANSASGLSPSQIESFIVETPNVRPGALTGGLQTASQNITWRKHDWPGRADAESRPEGYQASDSVEEDLPGGRVYVQTFDFGDAARRFQRFDLGQGDGGQALTILNGAVYASMTEDGGRGVQWFVGQGCGSSPQAGLRGWLFFDANAQLGAWRDRVARLKIERRLSSCPWFLDDAYTRWQRVETRFPYRISGPGEQARTGSFVVDAILSEHYGGSSIAAADHLERSWFGRGYGLLRWERWENADRSHRADLQDAALSLADSGRCAPIAGSVAPGPDWKMVDCRTWTNFVHLATPWKVAEFNWPRPDVLAQFASAFAGD
jgi:hypothetical protein